MLLTRSTGVNLKLTGLLIELLTSEGLALLLLAPRVGRPAFCLLQLSFQLLQPLLGMRQAGLYLGLRCCQHQRLPLLPQLRQLLRQLHHLPSTLAPCDRLLMATACAPSEATQMQAKPGMLLDSIAQSYCPADLCI